jgi:hypothetical protein
MLLEQITRMLATSRGRVVVAPVHVVVWSGALDAEAVREAERGVPPEQRATLIRLTGHSQVNFYGNDSLTEAMHRASLGGADAGGWR